ncbi:MAG: hypothetical protein IIT32_11420, partial [Bacteroidales bacterium]|nr:hypothetical protein [Bacteroidales bacterium]
MKYRSVQLGVIAISIASISILLLMLVFFYRVQQRENDNLSRITNEQRNTMVDNIFDIKLKQEQTPVFLLPDDDLISVDVVAHSANFLCHLSILLPRHSQYAATSADIIR